MDIVMQLKISKEEAKRYELKEYCDEANERQKILENEIKQVISEFKLPNGKLMTDNWFSIFLLLCLARISSSIVLPFLFNAFACLFWFVPFFKKRLNFISFSFLNDFPFFSFCHITNSVLVHLYLLLSVIFLCFDNFIITGF